MAEIITKEALELVSALRPFANSMGQKIIDTVLGLAEEIAGPEVSGLELDSLDERAHGVFQDTMESAVALFLVIVVLWLSRASVTARSVDRSKGEAGGSGRAAGPSQPAR